MSIEDRIENVIQSKNSLIEKSKLFIDNLSNEDVFRLMSFISDYNLKLNQLENLSTDELDKFETDIANLESDLEQMKQLSIDCQEDINNNNNNHDEDADDENEMIISLDSETKAKLNHKVRFSNNIVRFLRGPLKSMVHGTMHAVDVCAQGTKINETFFDAVQKGLQRQSTTFADMNSNWIIEGENPNRGYSSPSIWFRNPDNERILVKIQEHPLCAANEWLAYALGRSVYLPVNQVQIGIYNNHLVTLHRDVQNENEQTITFMNLPKAKRDLLLKHPIMISIDIFDFFIQNCDRNQQNILITLPKSDDIQHENLNKLKIHLIDHASSFGMGKFNAISLVAAKFHSKHLAVAKFNPIHKSKQFQTYLEKFPVADRPAVAQTLNNFASITNEQIDNWITEIQDLLSSSQYNRIYSVLIRQRDIAKTYAQLWNLSSSQHTISRTSEINLF